MRAMLAPALLWTLVIGCGLTAGVYFAFSAFIMTSLGRIPPASGMAAMNATIVDIVKSPFIPVFILTTLTAASLAVLGVVRWGPPGSASMVIGGAIYVLGMFGVTMVVNRSSHRVRRPFRVQSHDAAQQKPRHVRVTLRLSGSASLHRGDHRGFAWRPDRRVVR